MQRTRRKICVADIREKRWRYVDPEPWDGPKSLLEMMDIRDKRIIPFLNDYKLNIISVAEIADGDFGKFNTVLGKVLKIVKHQKEDADKLIEELGHTKIDPDAAFFLKKAANLDIEIEVKDGGRKSSGGRLSCADRSGA